MEEAGWDGISLWDHILVEDGLEVADPWVLLSAAAMVTERIRLITMVTPLPRRRPWKVARESVSLDHLSEGRLILGVGSGGPPTPSSAVSTAGEFSEPTPEAVRDLADYAHQHRSADGPFDIVVGGDPSRAEEFEESGVTWWRDGWAPQSGTDQEEWISAVLEGPPSDG